MFFVMFTLLIGIRRNGVWHQPKPVKRRMGKFWNGSMKGKKNLKRNDRRNKECEMWTLAGRYALA